MKTNFIFKKYNIILSGFLFLSSILLFVTPFIPALSFNLFGREFGEVSGSDFFFKLFEKDSTLFDFDPIKDALEQWGILLVAVAIFVTAIVSFVISLSSINSPYSKNYVSFRIFKALAYGLTFTTAYFLCCLLIILSSADWDFSGAFSSYASMTTKTFWPFLIELFLFVAAKIFYKYVQTSDRAYASFSDYSNNKNEDSEEMEYESKREQPIQPLKNTGTDSADHEVSQNIVEKEKEIISLIEKYKQLYEEGTITKEEFDSKRKELLGMK